MKRKQLSAPLSGGEASTSMVLTESRTVLLSTSAGVSVSATLNGRTSRVRRILPGDDFESAVAECIAEVSEPAYQGPFFRIEDESK